ncbi:MAG: ABC transporter ATP-binding protein [Candidatus Thorarchaeota archaeon]|jgi:oligopeptide/dipeptide ABC transporter ATP-binding protein
MSDGQSDVILRVENLSAYYTSTRGLVKAVEDVNFEVYEGEAVGIMGESGSGKSSVAMAILGIFEDVAKYGTSSGDESNRDLWRQRKEARKKGLTSKDIGKDLPGVEGKVWYRGKNLFTLSDKEYRKIRGAEITYVPQSTTKSLNPYTNIQLQTAEALWVHDDDDILFEREVLRRVLQALDLVELGDVDIRQALKPKEFSMGEDQRILIAMALIMNPAFMIMDEPTTALDVGVQRRIMDAIQIVREKLKLTMLLLSNDLGLHAEVAGRIGVMTAGKLVEFADVITILKRPRHPFTRAFLMSNPSMEMMKKIREKGLLLRGIPGNPPDMTNPPSGCVFHPRCEYCEEICKTEVPEYREIESGHMIACHRYEELPDFSL